MKKPAVILLAATASLLPGACSSRSGPSVPTCTIAPPTLSDWHLHASGTQLLDTSNRVVFLRGVDAGGRSKLPPYVPFDFAAGQYASVLASYMDRAASWGINVMRVPFTWSALEPTKGQDDQAWLAMYDQLLDAAWAHGIYTVIDFHQDVYAQVLCGDGFPEWTLVSPPAAMTDCPQWQLEYYNDASVTGAFDKFWAQGSTVQADYAAAWDVMVARYKNKPGVIAFEPINEPGWGTANVTTFEQTTLTDFYSTMVARMRAAAPTSLVFVDPPGVAGITVTTSVGRPTGDGVVFAPHFYPLAAEMSEVESGLAKWAAVGQSWNVPVFVGEFSVSNTSSTAAALMSAHFSALDTLGLSGAEWEYSVATLGWNGETDGMVAADGTEYPVVQGVIRPFAEAVAGSAITQSFDTTSGAFDLAFTPVTGITQISLPARAFPSGYNMTLTGACVDAATVPGELLLQPDSGAAQVSLHVTAK